MTDELPDDVVGRALDAMSARPVLEAPMSRMRAAGRVFVEWALEEAAKVAETSAESDLAYGRRYHDEYHKMEQRAHRARTIAAAIRALKETKNA